MFTFMLKFDLSHCISHSSNVIALTTSVHRQNNVFVLVRINRSQDHMIPSCSQCGPTGFTCPGGAPKNCNAVDLWLI